LEGGGGRNQKSKKREGIDHLVVKKGGEGKKPPFAGKVEGKKGGGGDPLSNCGKEKRETLLFTKGRVRHNHIP